MYSTNTFCAPWRTTLRSGATALVTALGVAWAGPAAAATVINIDPPGAFAAFAYGINDSGAVAGYYVDADGIHGFVRAPDGTYTTFNHYNKRTIALNINRKGQIAGYWHGDFVDHGYLHRLGGKFKSFDPQGAIGIEPWGINDTGTIAGFYEDGGSFREHGFVRTADGTLTTFDPGGSTGTFAWSVNAAGTVTGWYEDGGGLFHGFLRGADGTITAFDVSGSKTWPTNINDSGAVTGCYDNGAKCSGFIRTADGTTTSFDVPNASKTVPQAINRKGVIAGTSDETHGFVRYANGKIVSFDAPNSTRTYAWGINKDGAIVGYYLEGNNAGHSFLRTP